jgi:hypothetical protein
MAQFGVFRLRRVLNKRPPCGRVLTTHDPTLTLRPLVERSTGCKGNLNFDFDMTNIWIWRDISITASSKERQEGDLAALLMVRF